MKKTREQKAITLVALIITIIILLILAVVAIRSITGDGILQKAREAADATARGQIQEELDLAISNLIMEETMRKNMSQEEKAQWLQSELQKQDGNATVNTNGNGFTGNYKDHNFSVNEDYKVTIGDYAQNDNNDNGDDSQGGNQEDTDNNEDNQIAPCGIDGHYIGDDKGEHGVHVTDCSSGHTYTCECDSWTVPTSGKYYVGVTSRKLGDYTGATKVYNEGETLCYVPTEGDVFILGDYEYRYNGVFSSSSWSDISKKNGWGVRVLDIFKSSYGEILENIANKSITTIDYTFKDCTSLKTAPTIPSKVTTMNSAFYGCTALTTAPIIPNEIISMNRAFFKCKSLMSYVDSKDSNGDFSNYKLPQNVTGLNETFCYCKTLIIPPAIPEGAIDIGSTFEGCTALTTPPIIPSSVLIMNKTFCDCTKLITPPDMSNATNVRHMDLTFQNCKSLTSAPDIHNSVQYMKQTFYNCTSLIIAPDLSKATKLTDMQNTFSKCTSLKTVPVIPNSVTNMTDTFADCVALTGTIRINANPTQYDNCFKNVKFISQGITLTGSSTMLDRIKATGSNS